MILFNGSGSGRPLTAGRGLRQSTAALLTLLLVAGCARTLPQYRDIDPLVPAAPDQPVSKEDQLRRKLLAEARLWKGAPYRLGGTSKHGVDCSGLVMVMYRKVFGLRLPRTVMHQVRKGASVALADLKAGDLVFFRPSNKWRHVGIYMGEGRFFHASSTQGVTYSQLRDPYWQRHYWVARRLVGFSAP